MRTIAHISDIHFGRVDAPVAEGLVADLNQHPADVLVVSGDLTQRALRSQFEAATAFLKRLPSPQLVIPGNHDVPLYNLLARAFSPMSAYRKYATPNLCPVIADAELCIVGLNSARAITQTSGWLSASQLEEARNHFRAAPANAFKILVTHHPFIPPPRKPNADVILRGESYLPMLEAVGVDLLLAGHLHLAYHDDIRSHFKAWKSSILSVQAGTAISTRRRNEPNAYNLITVSQGLCTVAVRAWNGRQFEESAVTRYEKSGGTWATSRQVAVDSAARAVLGTR